MHIEKKKEEKKKIESQNININVEDENVKKEIKEIKDIKDIKEEYNKNNEMEENEVKKGEKFEKKNIEEKKEDKDNDKNEINKKDNEDNKKIIEEKENKEKNIFHDKKNMNKNNFINILNGDKNSKQIYNIVRECTFRLSQLENQIHSIINKDLNNLKVDLKNHDLENQSDFKMVDVKMNEILEKLTEYDKKIEDCTVKCASIDIFNIIKDSGDGTVDAAKLLFKSLEDKCFKKFDLIDARYKQEALDMLKMKKTVDNFVPKLDKVNREILHIKQNEEQQKEELVNNKNEANQQNEKTIKLFEEKNEEIFKKIIELKETIDKDINQKINNIEEKIKLIGKGEDSASSLFKLGLVGNNKVDEEKFQVLDKKINDVRKKGK